MPGTQVAAKLVLQGCPVGPRDRGAAAVAVLPGGFQLGVALRALTTHQVLTALRTEIDDPAHRERCPASAARGRRTRFSRRRIGLGSGTLPRCLGLGGNGGLARREPEIRLRIEDAGDGVLVQVDRRVSVLMQEIEIRI